MLFPSFPTKKRARGGIFTAGAQTFRQSQVKGKPGPSPSLCLQQKIPFHFQQS